MRAMPPGTATQVRTARVSGLTWLMGSLPMISSATAGRDEQQDAGGLEGSGRGGARVEAPGEWASGLHQDSSSCKGCREQSRRRYGRFTQEAWAQGPKSDPRGSRCSSDQWEN